MKHIYLFLLLLLILAHSTTAQTPALIWQRALGGSGNDIAYAVTSTPDGGYVVAGRTESTDGDVTSNHGNFDFWVVKFDESGKLIWQKTLGGSGFDEATAVTATSDGGIVVVGATNSIDGDVSGNHGNGDYWVVKLDETGKLIWQKTLGGSDGDEVNAVTPTSDGGVVVAGRTFSNDGDVSGNHGGTDYWVVKLDGSGKLIWQKALGGSGFDGAAAVTATSDGGYVVAGYTYSNDGDVLGNHGNLDYWVVKLDGLGKLIWQKALGGSSGDEATAVTATSDGGYVVAGRTQSNNGDVSGNHGSLDYWVVKLDGSGKLIWQKALGGSSSDYVQGVKATSDGGYVLAGYTSSTDGDVSGNHGDEDCWVIKLDKLGNKLWQKALGGRSYDDALAITTTSDGGYVVAGLTNSNDGDVSGYHGNIDGWVVKLGTVAPTITGLSASPNSIYAGQTISFTATVGNVIDGYVYTLTNGTTTTSGSSFNTAFSQSVTASGSGAQSFTLTIVNNGQTARASTNVTVNILSTTIQSPALLWQKTLGGNATALTPTPDGGYMVAGSIQSTNGGISNSDFWLVKLDGAGKLIWQKTLGGSGADGATGITPTPDGGYVVAGNTQSTDGDVTGNHGNQDYWVVKIDGSGKLLWQKALGGSKLDIANAVTTTSDGSIVVAGYTRSNDGDVSGNHGDDDYWVVKLDGSGKLIWQKTLGGSDTDDAYAVTATSNGGVVVAGLTLSSDGDASGNHRFSDFWIVRLDASGKLIWQTDVGGSDIDVALGVTATSDGGFVAAGYTFSTDGDVTGSHGEDCWLVKLDGAGKLIWQKALGGYFNDQARSVTPTSDGGVVIAGNAASNDGDVSGNHGGADFWVVRLDGTGKIIWQKALGGSGNDEARVIVPTSDGGYVVAGFTNSTDGDVSGDHSNGNAWVVKLGNFNSIIKDFSASPNPVCAGQRVNFSATVGTTGTYNYTLTNGVDTQTGATNDPAFYGVMIASDSGIQSFSLTLTINGLTATAMTSLTVNPQPNYYGVTGGGAYCQGGTGVAVGLSGSQIGINYQLSQLIEGKYIAIGSPVAGTGNPLSFGNQTTAGIYVAQATNNTTTCQQFMSGYTTVTVSQAPQRPTIATTSGQSYPAGVSSLTVSQNTGNVVLTVLGCADGTISWGGGSATALAVSTANAGVFSYSATCTRNGCVSSPAVATVTVVAAISTSLKVLYRDADYGQPTNNVIKPYLQLQNVGSSPIPYGEITVRYWFTSESNATPTDLAVYYAQLGPVQMQYMALAQPRQGALGYVEYRFTGGGSLAATSTSGPIENGIQKTDRSNFNESDDYSYQANYADYLPNIHITAYRNGVLVWGQEPNVVAAQSVIKVYSATKDGSITSQVQTRVEARNEGNTPVAVQNIKLRYYFTSDNGQLANVYVDYADIGAQNVQASVVKLSPTVAGADSYVELTFPSSTLVLSPLSSLGTIDFRLVRSDYGLFDQTNDYSYAANYGNVGMNTRITAYVNGSLVFGSAPTGAARVAAAELGFGLDVRLLGNPTRDNEVRLEVRGAEGQPLRLVLSDGQGRQVSEQVISSAEAIERRSLSVGIQSSGVLFLQASTPTQNQVIKVLKTN